MQCIPLFSRRVNGIKKVGSVAIDRQLGRSQNPNNIDKSLIHIVAKELEQFNG